MANENQTEDITHEEVNFIEQFANQEIARLMTPEQQAQQEIKKFNLADSAIQALNQKYGELTINGLEDRDGYKAVREAWQEVRSKRTGLEKKGLELRNGYTVITRAISKEEKRLVEAITPLEEKLYEKWKRIDEEKERIKAEQEEAEEREFMSRLQVLQDFGMTLKDGFYSIGDSIQLDAAVLRAMPEDRFLELRDKAKAIFDEEAKKQVEQLKLAREQVAREKAEREEFARQQRELEEQKKKLAAEAEEFQKQIVENRVNRFIGLGMKKIGGELLIGFRDAGEVSVMIGTLRNYTGAQFEKFFEEVSNSITELKKLQAERDLKAEEEKKEQERKEKFIAEQMEKAGLRYNYGKREFEFFNEVLNLTRTWDYFANATDENIIEQAAGLKKRIEDAKQQAEEKEKERAAEAERERQEGLTDAELFKDLLGMTKVLRDTYAKFKLKTKAYRSMRSEILKFLDEILERYNDYK